jgi:hypothetical protein
VKTLNAIAMCVLTTVFLSFIVSPIVFCWFYFPVYACILICVVCASLSVVWLHDMVS